MKKCIIGIAAALLLSGCGAQPTFETIADEYLAPAMAPLQQIRITLPEDAAVPVLESDSTGKLYVCEGYTLTVQTASAGDMEKTLQTATGFSEENLNIIRTRAGNLNRLDTVWTAAGEGGDQVGRLSLLDDGSYYYILTAMAPASGVQAVEEDWDQIFDSFSLVSPEEDLHTGS